MKSANFESKWNRTPSPESSPGEKLAPSYKLTAENDLELDGYVDIVAEIQSHADSCDINTIMLRYEMGDVQVLNKRNTQFVDVTEIPTNMAEMFKLAKEAEHSFDSLPLEVRKEYNFSITEYLNDFGSDRWYEVTSGKKSEEKEKKEDE